MAIRMPSRRQPLTGRTAHQRPRRNVPPIIPAPQDDQTVDVSAIQHSATERLLTDLGLARDALQNLTRQQLERRMHTALAGVSAAELQEKIDSNWPCKRELGLVSLGLHIGPPFTRISPERFQAIIPEIERRLVEWAKSEFTGSSPAAHDIEQPEPKTHERPMLDKAKSFTHDGVRYFPLSVAAPVAQAPVSTLRDWIKKKTKIDGRPLQTYYFAPADLYMISAESINRAANRFIKWPSEEPTGPVTLGETRDQSGYIGLTDAARELGIGHHTIWRWTTKGTAPTDEPLDVIKDPASDQLYIRQRDISALKKLIPRGGLRAGRRPQPGLQPN